MADLREYRKRVPVVGRMIEQAFNGDISDDESKVDFVLITSKPDGGQRVSSTVANFPDLKMVVGLMLMAISQDVASFTWLPDDDEPVGHA